MRTASDPAPAGAFERKLQQARASGSRNVSSHSNGLTTAGEEGGRRRVVAFPVACTHTIRQGDTYGIIAARHLGSSKRWPDLVRANPGIDPNRLRVGNRINLPCDGTAGQGGAVPRPLSATKPGEPLAGTGFLAALFGSGSQSPAASGAGKKEAGASTAQAGKNIDQTAAGAAQTDAKKTAKMAQLNRKAAPAATATSSAKPPAPVKPPLPLWTAKQGEYLADVLKRWGKTAGYTVIVDTSEAWKIGVQIRMRAGFEAAVDELVAGLGHGGPPPRVRLYPNKVVRLGGSL